MVLESGGSRAGGGLGGERCSICLEPISGEGYLDQCFHKFCYHCILQWSEMVIFRPSSTSNPLQYLECPLCKQTQYTSIIHDVSGGRFQRHYILTSRIPGLLKSEAHIRRQAVYSAHSGPAHPQSSRLTNVVPKANRWLSCWVQRELQVLMQEEDVETVMHHVVGIVESFSTRSKGKVSSSGRQGTKGEDFTWHATISAAVRPFIFESAERFAVELESFLVSGLDIAAYDQKSKLAACAPELVTHSDEEITLPSLKKDIQNTYDLYDEDVDEEFDHVMVRKTSSELERFSSEERSDMMKQHIREEDAGTQERKSSQRDPTVSRPMTKDSIKHSVKDSGSNLDRGRSKHRSESRRKRKSRSSSSRSSSPHRHKCRKRDKSVKSRSRKKRKHSKKKDKRVSQEHKRKSRKSRTRKYDHSSSDSGSDSESSRSGRSLSPAERGARRKARKKDQTSAEKPVTETAENRKMQMLDVEQRTRDRRKSPRRRRLRSYEPREKSGKERPDERLPDIYGKHGQPRSSHRGAQEFERKGKYSSDADGRSLSRSPEPKFRTDGISLSRSQKRRFRADGGSLSRSPERRFTADGRSLSRSPERRLRADGKSLSRSPERRFRADGRSLSRSPESRFRARQLSRSISPRAREGRNSRDGPGSSSPHSPLAVDEEQTERWVPSSEIRAQRSDVVEEDANTLETKLREQALANLMRHLSQKKITTTSTSVGNPEESSVVEKATQEFDAPSATKETDLQAPPGNVRLDDGGRKDVEEGDQEGCLETDSKHVSEDDDHVQAAGDDAHSDTEFTRPTKDDMVEKVHSAESRSSLEAVEEVLLEGRQLSGVSYGKATSLEGKDIVVELVVDTEPFDFEIPFRGSTGPMEIADQRGKKKRKSERELVRQGHANGIEDNFADGERFVQQSCDPQSGTKSPLEAREQSVLMGNLLPCSKGSKGPSSVGTGRSLELPEKISVVETSECRNREEVASVDHESAAIPAALMCDVEDVEHTDSAAFAEESAKTESTSEKTPSCLNDVSRPETSSKVREDGDEAGESEKFQQKSMSVTRGGESVQVSYKVYIPQRAAGARRRLKR